MTLTEAIFVLSNHFQTDGGILTLAITLFQHIEQIQSVFT